MRINATFIQGLVASATNLSSQEADISDSISSGVRLNKLSDDPVAAGQAATMADSLRRDDAFTSTANTVGNRMQAADTALSSVVTQLTSAVSTAVGVLNGTGGSSDRAIASQQLKAVRETLLSLANSSYAGSYLFSGASSGQPFSQAADGSVTYTGGSTTSSIQLLSGGSVQSSLAGSSVFLASGASVFDSLNAIITSLDGSGTSGDDSATLVGNLRSALDNVTSQRATLDTAQNRLSSEKDYVTSQKANLSAEQTTLLSADTASLATQLSAVTTQRSALLSTIGIVEKGSLFDYLQ